MYWLIVALALLAAAGILIGLGLRDVERRVEALTETLAVVRKTADDGADSARRAHLRADNHQRQLDALGKELGWVDDRSLTKVLTAPSGALPPTQDR